MQKTSNWNLDLPVMSLMITRILHLCRVQQKCNILAHTLSSSEQPGGDCPNI